MEKELNSEEMVELLANYFLYNPDKKSINQSEISLLIKEKDRRYEKRKLKM
jgi:hypothetical protein